jgi:hypothetical protein
MAEMHNALNTADSTDSGRKYYTLMIQEDVNEWYIAFGDYSKVAVMQECDSYPPRRLLSAHMQVMYKILESGDSQESINSAVADFLLGVK